MGIPFCYAAKHKMTIQGMAILAMFFGCRVSGEKNGILRRMVKLVLTILCLQFLRLLLCGKAVDHFIQIAV